MLIQNGTVVTSRETFLADVLIEGERIKEVGPNLTPAPGAAIIDAQGLYVMPGGIDAHTHLDMPFGGSTSADDFLTGTRAAAFGGTTSIIDFAIQPRGTRMRDALDTWWKKAEGKAVIDYGLHMIVTDLPDAGLEDMDDMVNEGVASFKLFMAYPNVLMVDDATIFRALSRTAKNGALDLHARRKRQRDRRHHSARPRRRQNRAHLPRPHPSAARRSRSGPPRHRHGRNRRSPRLHRAPVFRRRAQSGSRSARPRRAAFAETCPQYLLLSIEELERPNFEGAKYVFTPPLRPKSHQPKLWDGLKHDHLQVVSTDHCPFCFEDQKMLGKDDFTKIPNGGPGIENRLQLLYNHGVSAGKLSLNRFVEITSTAPARIFGMYPRKGEIAPGSDADLVLWDPNAAYTISARTHHMRVDYSMFEGYEIRGNAKTVISRGEVIVDNNQFLGKPGRGAYLRRAARGGAWQ